jgi:hypothetical protein
VNWRVGHEWWLPLHNSRRDLESSVGQALIGYVGFAASISAAPPAVVGRALTANLANSRPEACHPN